MTGHSAGIGSPAASAASSVSRNRCACSASAAVIEKHVFVDETLSRHGAAKSKEAFVARAVRRRRRRRRARQHGVTHIRQKAFEADVCYGIALQQAAQQLIVRQRSHCRRAEQFRDRKPCRPRRIGARDAVIHDAVELDKTDARAGKLARGDPAFRERAQHQAAISSVVHREPRKFGAMSEQGLGLRSLPQFKRATRGLDGPLGLPRPQIGLGEISARLVQIGLECECTLEVGNGFAGLAPRHQRGAESAVRLGMGGKKREDVPVMTLGFDECPGLMMRHGRAEQLGKRPGSCRVGGEAERRCCPGGPRGSPLFAVHGAYRWLNEAVRSASELAQTGQLSHASCAGLTRASMLSPTAANAG